MALDATVSSDLKSGGCQGREEEDAKSSHDFVHGNRQLVISDELTLGVDE